MSNEPSYCQVKKKIWWLGIQRDSPQNPSDKTQMFPFDFLLVVLSKMRALARALISLLVSKTTGYLSISAPWDNTGVPCPVGCLAMGGQGRGRSGTEHFHFIISILQMLNSILTLSCLYKTL